jgi:hypothetical protein
MGWFSKKKKKEKEHGPPNPADLPDILSKAGPGTFIEIYGDPVAKTEGKSGKHEYLDNVTIPKGSQGLVRSIGDLEMPDGEVIETIGVEIIEIPVEGHDEQVGELYQFRLEDIQNYLTEDTQGRWAEKNDWYTLGDRVLKRKRKPAIRIIAADVESGNIPDWLFAELEHAAESDEYEDTSDLYATKDLENAYDEYVEDLGKALREVVSEDIAEEMETGVNTSGGVPVAWDTEYNVYHDLSGSGIGIGDGRWDHFEQQGVDLEDLEDHLKTRLSIHVDGFGGGKLEQAMHEAIYETLPPKDIELTCPVTRDDITTSGEDGDYTCPDCGSDITVLNHNAFHKANRQNQTSTPETYSWSARMSWREGPDADATVAYLETVDVGDAHGTLKVAAAEAESGAVPSIRTVNVEGTYELPTSTVHPLQAPIGAGGIWDQITGGQERRDQVRGIVRSTLVNVGWALNMPYSGQGSVSVSSIHRTAELGKESAEEKVDKQESGLPPGMEGFGFDDEEPDEPVGSTAGMREIERNFGTYASVSNASSYLKPAGLSLLKRYGDGRESIQIYEKKNALGWAVELSKVTDASTAKIIGQKIKKNLWGKRSPKLTSQQWHLHDLPMWVAYDEGAERIQPSQPKHAKIEWVGDESNKRLSQRTASKDKPEQYDVYEYLGHGRGFKNKRNAPKTGEQWQLWTRWANVPWARTKLRAVTMRRVSDGVKYHGSPRLDHAQSWKYLGAGISSGPDTGKVSSPKPVGIQNLIKVNDVYEYRASSDTYRNSADGGNTGHVASIVVANNDRFMVKARRVQEVILVRVPRADGTMPNNANRSLSDRIRCTAKDILDRGKWYNLKQGLSVNFAGRPAGTLLTDVPIQTLRPKLSKSPVVYQMIVDAFQDARIGYIMSHTKAEIKELIAQSNSQIGQVIIDAAVDELEGILVDNFNAGFAPERETAKARATHVCVDTIEGWTFENDEIDIEAGTELILVHNRGRDNAPEHQSASAEIEVELLEPYHVTATIPARYFHGDSPDIERIPGTEWWEDKDFPANVGPYYQPEERDILVSTGVYAKGRTGDQLEIIMWDCSQRKWWIENLRTNKKFFIADTSVKKSVEEDGYFNVYRNGKPYWAKNVPEQEAPSEPEETETEVEVETELGPTRNEKIEDSAAKEGIYWMNPSAVLRPGHSELDKLQNEIGTLGREELELFNGIVEEYRQRRPYRPFANKKASAITKFDIYEYVGPKTPGSSFAIGERWQVANTDNATGPFPSVTMRYAFGVGKEEDVLPSELSSPNWWKHLGPGVPEGHQSIRGRLISEVSLNDFIDLYSKRTHVDTAEHVADVLRSILELNDDNDKYRDATLADLMSYDEEELIAEMKRRRWDRPSFGMPLSHIIDEIKDGLNDLGLSLGNDHLSVDHLFSGKEEEDKPKSDKDRMIDFILDENEFAKNERYVWQARASWRRNGHSSSDGMTYDYDDRSADVNSLLEELPDETTGKYGTFTYTSTPSDVGLVQVLEIDGTYEMNRSAQLPVVPSKADGRSVEDLHGDVEADVKEVLGEDIRDRLRQSSSGGEYGVHVSVSGIRRTAKLHVTADDIATSIEWNGLPIDIEWKAGDVREHGNSDYQRYMVWSYGYLRGTDSADGEELDCFVGPKEDVDTVFVCVQKSGDFEVSEEGAEEDSFDEFDVILGAEDKSEAEAIMRLHYADNQIGAIFELPLASFKELVLPQIGKTSAFISVEHGDGDIPLRHVEEGNRVRLPDGRVGDVVSVTVGGPTIQVHLEEDDETMTLPVEDLQLIPAIPPCA